MTAWWMSTTSVKKERARSIEKLRALAFGAARTFAVATVWEIDDMGALGTVMAPNVATGNSIQQGPIGKFGKAGVNLGFRGSVRSSHADRDRRGAVVASKKQDVDGRERREVYVVCAKQTTRPGHDDLYSIPHATSSIVTLSG